MPGQGDRPPRHEGPRGPRPDGKFGDRGPRRDDRRDERRFDDRPKRAEKPIDPDSPFAKLMALKAELESKGDKKK
jgi:ATP-dependent RNA helicase SUPV3L1/SUV3